MKKRCERHDRGLSGREVLEIEDRRLREGLGDDEKLIGVGRIAFAALCPGNASQVLPKVVEALLMVNEMERVGPWPSNKEWLTLMPRWLYEASAPWPTEQEKRADLVRWSKMSFDQKWHQPGYLPYSPLQWVFWMRSYPECKRHWFWWDAEVVNDDAIVFAVDELDDPVPYGALMSLFVAAGATRIHEVLGPTMPGDGVVGELEEDEFYDATHGSGPIVWL